MKVTFEYDLPEQQDEYEEVLEAPHNSHIIFELRHNFARNWKHKEGWSEEQWEAYDEVMDKLFELLNSEDLL